MLRRLANSMPKVKLTQESYTVAEIAYILGVTTRTVRAYMARDSVKRPGEKLLPATKPATLWRVSRASFESFLNEEFG